MSSCPVVRIGVLALVALASPCRAGMDSGHYVLDPVLTGGYTLGITSPSASDGGDLVVRGRVDATNAEVAALHYDAAAKTYSRVLVRPGATMGAFPQIAPDRSVATINFFNPYLIVQRHDFDGTVYAPTTIAWGNVGGSEPGRPFDSIEFYTEATAGGVTFLGWAPSIGKGFFRSPIEVQDPAGEAMFTLSTAGFSDFDAYFDADGTGDHIAFRGTTMAAETGVFLWSTGAITPLATDANGFLDTDGRPGVNALGTVAFRAIRSDGASNVFLRLASESVAREAGSAWYDPATAPTHGVAPTTVLTGEKVSVNDFNQAAWIGTDASGTKTLFSTNLGSIRRIAAVGDLLDPLDSDSVVTDMRLFDGLMPSGQIAWLATTVAGQRVVRTLRAYGQAPLSDGPFAVPWASRGYLRKDLGDFGGAGAGTIRRFGCNLTSTANALGFFDFNLTPGEFQDWLLAKWRAAPPDRKARYVNARNDFPETVVEEYTLERGGPFSVRTRGTFASSTTGGGLAKIVSELRIGQPVKVRVPSFTGTPRRLEAMGHYVLAYGLVDPSRGDAVMTSADVLIHDPGHGGDYTLFDYERDILGGASPSWLDDGRSRLYLYGLASGTHGDMAIGVHSPVEVVLTDPSGRRLGRDPSTGIFAEIPGGSRWSDETFFTNDPDDLLPRAWESDEPIGRLLVEGADAGNWSLEIIGIGSGPYEITVVGLGRRDCSPASITGTAIAGSREVVTITVSETPVPRTAMLLRSNALTSLVPLSQQLSSILPLDPVRDTYVVSFASGNVDPQPDVLADPAHPLIYYSIDLDATLLLAKTPEGRLRLSF